MFQQKDLHVFFGLSTNYGIVRILKLEDHDSGCLCRSIRNTDVKNTLVYPVCDVDPCSRLSLTCSSMALFDTCRDLEWGRDEFSWSSVALRNPPEGHPSDSIKSFG